MEMLAEVMANLNKNGFQASLAETAVDAKEMVLGLIPPGAAVGVGGSVTIRQLHLIETLCGQGHEVHDHWQQGLSPEEIREIKLRQIASPVFLTSTNALTRDGKLVNIDNTGNRVAAMIFGPQHVIVVAGINKIVANLEEALRRIKEKVAPVNTRRRQDQTPCAVTGKCEDCHSPHRLCRVTTILERKTRGVGTFSVIMVKEDLGY
ncbi:MAG: lactate utilization protein [Desulfobaccales bacterium]